MTDAEAVTTSFQSAVLALHHPLAPSDTRQAADKWLRTLARTEEGWNFIFSLCISNPGERWSPEERLIAASLLSSISLKGPIRLQSIPHAETVLLSLGRAVLYAADSGAQATAAALSRSMAALIIRSPCMPESEAVALLLGALTSAADTHGDMPQDESQQCALLRGMSALAEVSAQSTLSVHPMRRQAVQSALCADTIATSLVVSALSEHAPDAVKIAAMQVVRAWCGCAGCAPAGFALEGLGALHWAVLSRPSLRYEAAETIAALYQTGGGSLMPHLLNHLPGAMAGLASQACQHPPQASEIHFAALTILGAATAAAASALSNRDLIAHLDCSAAADFLAEQLLSLLKVSGTDVDSVLANLAVWDDWMSTNESSCRPPTHHVGRLLECLLDLAQLPQGLSIHQATADARDLPEEVRHIRREVADTLKLASISMGEAGARQQIAHAAIQAQAVFASTMKNGGDASGNIQYEIQQNNNQWIRLEACLYALNLVPKGIDLDALFQITALGVEALLPEVPKLAGTALTLLGGLAHPYSDCIMSRPEALLEVETRWQCFNSAIRAIARLVQHPTDAKLARNAATTLHRLSSAPPLAAVIVQQVPNVLEDLNGWYALHTAGAGAQCLVKTGVDETTCEYMLRTLCNLNMHCVVLRHHHAQAAHSLDLRSSNDVHLVVAALHVHALGMVLRECKDAYIQNGQSTKEGRELFKLPELDASAIGSLLNTSVSAIISANLSNTDACGSFQLASASATCAGQLVAAFPLCAEHAVQILVSVAGHCGKGALEAMQTVVSSAEESAANKIIEASQGIVVQARRAVHVAVVQGSDRAESEELVLLLQIRLLQQICMKWPDHVISKPLFIELALETLQHCMPHSNREICEASVKLSAAIMSLRTGLQEDSLIAAVHFLLCSASGGHPSYMVLEAADAAHAGWMSQGSGRYKAAMLAAIHRLRCVPIAGGVSSPWANWKEDLQHSVLDDLLSEKSAADCKRFKRIFKQLCGGKRKGTEGAPPGRIRDL